MKFIKKQSPKEDTRVGYLLTIETMIGDADGFGAIHVGIFRENELHLLEEVITVCDRMIEAYPRGRGGGDNYNHVDGFERWFTELYEGDYSDIENVAPFMWNYNPSYDDIQDSIDGYTVTYLDNGKIYDVEIIK